VKEEMRNVDELLASENQARVSRIVHSLPEEAPSMLWRSGLNEAVLAQCKAVHQRRRFWTFARPTLGLGAACVLAFAVFLRVPSPQSAVQPLGGAAVTSETPSVEASLFEIHRTDVRASDVVGSGLDPTDSPADADQGSVPNNDDSEADLEL
jgi:hypothetical protein